METRRVLLVISSECPGESSRESPGNLSIGSPLDPQVSFLKNAAVVRYGQIRRVMAGYD